MLLERERSGEVSQWKNAKCPNGRARRASYLKYDLG